MTRTPPPVLLFTISGLRGIVGQSLTPELACAAAAGFGRLVRSRVVRPVRQVRLRGAVRVALGRDCRSSGEMLSHAAICGLVSTGCDVLDLGICPTPTIPFLVRKERLGGGLMITASHNPPEWNGVKFVSAAGAFLTEPELATLKRIIKAEHQSQEHKSTRAHAPRPTSHAPRPCRAFRTGMVIARHDAIDLHIRQILNSSLFRNRVRRRLGVGVDACNGAASRAAVELVRRLGGQAFPLFCDPEQGGVFPRGPEPTSEHLEALSAFVRRRKLDFGAAFDPDGDRFSVVDEQGRALGEEATVMLATDFVLKWKPGPVVVNLSTTQGIDDIAARHQVRVFRTRVGEAAVAAKMKEIKAQVGGEGNGGVIVPAINSCRDGLVALAIAYQAVSEAGLLSDLARRLPRYAMVKDRVQPCRSWTQLEPRLARAFAGWRQGRTDGLRIVRGKAWLHVRPSNTEPIVRLIAEAPTATEANRLVRQAKRLIRRNPNV